MVVVVLVTVLSRQHHVVWVEEHRFAIFLPVVGLGGIVAQRVQQASLSVYELLLALARSSIVVAVVAACSVIIYIQRKRVLV